MPNLKALRSFKTIIYHSVQHKIPGDLNHPLPVNVQMLAEWKRFVVEAYISTVTNIINSAIEIPNIVLKVLKPRTD